MSNWPNSKYDWTHNESGKSGSVWASDKDEAVERVSRVLANSIGRDVAADSITVE